MTFGARLHEAVAARGPLCVGIDPHAPLLAAWGLEDSAAGAREFGLRVVEAASGRAGVVKPQLAFFERHGAAGYAAAEEVLAAARAAGLLVIADVKRGDVGSTVEAAAAAWLTPGSPLEADAMTAVAYQGVGSLDGVIALAEAHAKGVFVLAATSNPEARAVQSALVDGATVARRVADDVLARRSPAAASAPLDTLGLVIGGTVSMAGFGLDPAALDRTPILAPGFGHQGADFSRIPELYGPARRAVLPSASRSLLAAGPDGLADAIRAAAGEVIAACRA